MIKLAVLFVQISAIMTFASLALYLVSVEAVAQIVFTVALSVLLVAAILTTMSFTRDYFSGARAIMEYLAYLLAREKGNRT